MNDTGDRIIDATMRLLSDRPFEEVTLQAIADEAGVSLATLAAHFPTRGHVLDAFSRRIDQEVLSRDFTDMADQSGRDRLFDVLMSRLDSLAPHRPALKQLMRAVRRDPALAAGLNAVAMRSMTWMLAAAGIAPTGGWRGRIVTQGLAVSFARVLRVFVDEEDPGLPRTMAALDKELRRDEERYRRFTRLFGDAVREAPPRGADVPEAEVVADEAPPAAAPVPETPKAAPAAADDAGATQATAPDTPASPPADPPAHMPGPEERGDTLPGGENTAPPPPPAAGPSATGGPGTGPAGRDISGEDDGSGKTPS